MALYPSFNLFTRSPRALLQYSHLFGSRSRRIVRTTTSGQNEGVQSQVDGMLNRFLVQDRTIILAVIPSNVDIATVDILERATKVDPKGVRTIGVLTKPDLVDEGGEPEVLEVLNNRKKPLLHGYYMLKNRSQKELEADIGIRAARESERCWLAASLYAASGVGRLGVEALTAALTELLVDRIESVVPQMTAEVDAEIDGTRREIAALGDAPPDTTSARRAFAGASVCRVARNIRSTTSQGGPIVCGDDEAPGILQRELQLRKAFAAAVHATRPEFEDDGVAAKVTQTTDPGLLLEVKRREVGEIILASKLKSFWKSDPPTLDKKGMRESVNDCKKYGYCEHEIIQVPCFRTKIADRIAERRGRELPGFMNFRVFSDLMTEYTERWREPTNEFQRAVRAAASEVASKFARAEGLKWGKLGSGIEEEISLHFDEMDACAVSQLNQLLEQDMIPMTENHYLWDTINKIRNERTAKKIDGLAPDPNDKSLVRVSKATLKAMLNSDIGNDSNESQEVQDMIDMLGAYWKLASKRYIDAVCMTVTNAYTSPQRVNDLEERLNRALVTGIDESALERMFAPDAKRERTRAEKLRLLAAMEAARARIAEFVG